MVPKPIGGTLTGATIRLRKHKSTRVNRTITFGKFERMLCEEVMSMLPLCFVGMDVMSGQECFPYPVL